MPRRWIVLILSLLLSHVAFAAPVVQEARWGFDGTHVVYDDFNLLWVHIYNPDSTPYKETLVLERRSGSTRIGAQWVAECYISPKSSRWVQFSPWCSVDAGEWKLTLPGVGRLTLPEPKVGKTPPMILWDGNPMTLPLQGELPPFPELLFPTTVSQMRGVTHLAMRHTPNWEPVRMQALMDWVAGGGTLYLLPDASGNYPQFEGELLALNNPADEFAIGFGRVLRRTSAEEVPTTAPTAKTIEIDTNYYSTYGNGTPQEVLEQLRYLVRPKYNWTLLWLMSALYLAVIGPGQFLVNRRAPRLRVSLAALLGTIAVFCGIFYYVGGVGEKVDSKAISLTYARQIGQQRFDAQQWGLFLAGEAGEYPFQHSSKHRLYSVRSGVIADAYIHGPLNGTMVADIPVRSLRDFAFRGVFDEGPPLVTIEKMSFGEMVPVPLPTTIEEDAIWRPPGAPVPDNTAKQVPEKTKTPSLDLAVRIDEPGPTQILTVYAAWDNNLVQLKQQGARWVLAEHVALIDTLNHANSNSYYGYLGHDNEGFESLFSNASYYSRPLLMHALDIQNTGSRSVGTHEQLIEPGRLELLIIMRTPDAWEPATPGLKNGIALLHQTYFPETTHE